MTFSIKLRQQIVNHSPARSHSVMHDRILVGRTNLESKTTFTWGLGWCGWCGDTVSFARSLLQRKIIYSNICIIALSTNSFKHNLEERGTKQSHKRLALRYFYLFFWNMALMTTSLSFLQFHFERRFWLWNFISNYISKFTPHFSSSPASPPLFLSVGHDSWQEKIKGR